LSSKRLADPTALPISTFTPYGYQSWQKCKKWQSRNHAVDENQGGSNSSANRIASIPEQHSLLSVNWYGTVLLFDVSSVLKAPL
jgi:hypothetical protein